MCPVSFQLSMTALPCHGNSMDLGEAFTQNMKEVDAGRRGSGNTECLRSGRPPLVEDGAHRSAERIDERDTDLLCLAWRQRQCSRNSKWIGERRRGLGGLGEGAGANCRARHVLAEENERRSFIEPFRRIVPCDSRYQIDCTVSIEVSERCDGLAQSVLVDEQAGECGSGRVDP